MKPTFRAVLFVALGIPLSLALVIANESLWPLGLAYLGIAILVIGVDGIALPRKRAIEVEVEPPKIIFIGETEDFIIQVRLAANRSGFPLELKVETGEILQTPDSHVMNLIPAAVNEARVKITPERRGQGEIERIWFRWVGPLGLMQMQMVYHVGAQVPVVPNSRAVTRNALRLSSHDAFFGQKPQKQQGEGSEFDALRDYVPGLDHRSIDWKHSARHLKLVCKEFQTERNHQVVLAFDSGHLMSDPIDGIPKIDYAISAGLLLAYASLRSGDRIGVFGFDSRVRLSMEPRGGVQSFALVQRASSEIEYRYEETNFTLGLTDLMGRLNRRSLVILMTDFIDTVTAELMVENLERLSARHLVLFVSLRDPYLYSTQVARPDDTLAIARSVVASDAIRERRIIIERLRRLGVHCVDADSRDISVELLNRYMEIKRLELI